MKILIRKVLSLLGENMPIDISLIPQERIKDLVSTLDTIQNNISTIDGNLTTTTSNLSTLQTNVSNNYTTLDNKIDSESSRIINIWANIFKN